MRKVFKFPISLVPTRQKFVRFLMAGTDGRGQTCVWLEVDESGQEITRDMRMFPTGAEIPDGWEHGGSFMSGPFVWHVYHGPVD